MTFFNRLLLYFAKSLHGKSVNLVFVAIDRGLIVKLSQNANFGLDGLEQGLLRHPVPTILGFGLIYELN